MASELVSELEGEGVSEFAANYLIATEQNLLSTEVILMTSIENGDTCIFLNSWPYRLVRSRETFCSAMLGALFIANWPIPSLLIL